MYIYVALVEVCLWGHCSLGKKTLGRFPALDCEFHRNLLDFIPFYFISTKNVVKADVGVFLSQTNRVWMAFLYRWWRETIQGTIPEASKKIPSEPVLVSECCQTETAYHEDVPSSQAKESELQQKLDSVISNQMKGNT
jgi:hypothetical protein